jgi:hypothetical protein
MASQMPAWPTARILVAVVADSSDMTRARVSDGMRHIDETSSSHGSRMDWTICAYDDGASRWQDVAAMMLSSARLVSVINATAPGLMDPEQRRARGVHRKRAVEAAWGARGLDAWDAVWLADADIAFGAFDLATFLQRRACALHGGPPLIVQPVVRQNTQCWPYNYETYHTRSSMKLGHRAVSPEPADPLWEKVLALRTAWVESQAALLDAQFLAWFYTTPVVKRVLLLQNLTYHVSWGTDAIWCGAAKEFAAMHHLTRDPCAVITVPIDHMNTKSIGSKGGSYLVHGFRLLERAKIVNFRHHACTVDDPFRKTGWGCPDRKSIHPWFNPFMYHVCEHRTRPNTPSDMLLVQRCASSRLRDSCDVDGGGRGDAATIRIHGYNDTDRRETCRELTPLYEQVQQPQREDVHPEHPHDTDVRNASSHTFPSVRLAVWHRDGPVNALHLRALSEQLRELSITRRQVEEVALPVKRVALNHCGDLLAPFSGRLLLGLEEHLVSYGTPFNDSHWLVSITERASPPRRNHTNGAPLPPNTSASTGYHHAAIPLIAADHRRLLLPPDADDEPLVLRTPIDRPARVSLRDRCRVYRHSVWNVYVSWVLGELAVTPRAFFGWVDWRAALRPSFVFARWLPVEGAVALEVPASVADSIVGQIRLVAHTGLVLLDLKPRDMLVRRPPPNSRDLTSWDARLTDIEISSALTTSHCSSGPVGAQPKCYSNITSLTGILPSVTSECRLLLSLQLPTAMFACGPLRNTKLARSFTRRFLKLVDGDPDNVDSSGPVPEPVLDWAAHVDERCRPDAGLGGGFGLDDTGFLPAEYVRRTLVEKTILDNKRRVTMHALMEQMLRSRRSRRTNAAPAGPEGRESESLVCPSHATWDKTFLGQLG